MIRISLLILLSTLGFTLGSNCQDISGVWRNQLGSNMTIVHIAEDRITGTYKTAVESEVNAAVETSNITGTFAALDEGALLSFTVLFNREKSLTTWVGQCLVCDGEEILFTSWVLRSYEQKASDRWMVNHVNQDIFIRVLDNDHMADHHSTLETVPKSAGSEQCGTTLKAPSKGKWITKSGDNLHFVDCDENGVLSGRYLNSTVTGRSDGSEHATSLGFVSLNDKKVKGWAGHIYKESNERVLQTTWLQHSFSNDCKDPFSDLRLGMTNYTKEFTNEASFGTTSSPKNFGKSIWQKFLSLIKG